MKRESSNYYRVFDELWKDKETSRENKYCVFFNKNIDKKNLKKYSILNSGERLNITTKN